MARAAGAYNQLITAERLRVTAGPTETGQTNGLTDPTWQRLWQRWACVFLVRAQQLTEAQQLTGLVYYDVYLRQDADTLRLTSADRIVWQQKDWAIVTPPTDPTGQQEEIRFQIATRE